MNAPALQPNQTGDGGKPAERPAELQAVIDDFVTLLIRETRAYPSGKKSLTILARLQPAGPWQRMLDFMEHERLQGIATKITSGHASPAEVIDHRRNMTAVTDKIAAHREDDAARLAAAKGGA